MLASDFQAKIRKLNSSLRIFCGDDDRKSAGLFRVVAGEYTPIMGVDKHWLPEWPIVDASGRFVKGGWRRVVRQLIDLKLVDRRNAERVFGTQIVGTRRPVGGVSYSDPIQKEIEAASRRGFEHTGKPVIKRDDLVDIANTITKTYEDELCKSPK